MLKIVLEVLKLTDRIASRRGAPRLEPEFIDGHLVIHTTALAVLAVKLLGKIYVSLTGKRKMADISS